MLKPTAEQAAAAEAFEAGDHLVIQAGAGTGTTTTLALLAHATRRRGRYLAFNRAIAQAAAQAFPRTVVCKTAHSLAFAAIGHRYAARLNAPRIPSWRTGVELGINRSITLDGRDLSPRVLSALVLRTVERFCHSADPVLGARHVPRLRGIDTGELHAELADLVLPYAGKAWADLQHPDQGVVRFEHDHYLKMWALSQPRIGADFLLLDEAQDTNPVLEEVFLNQRGHAQLVMVGDSAQAIYGWRGAKDVMTGFDGTLLTLSRSFRFGPALAQEANRWLTIAQAPIRLTGTDTIPSEICEVEEPEAVLCRTNVGTMIEIMKHLDDGCAVALAGGGQALRALAHAADCLIDERHAEVTVSTAHKAKGRQWTTVRIADDFAPPPDQEETDENGRPLPGPIDDTEARLAYVAVTRARYGLDLGGLSWIHHHPAGQTDDAPTALQAPSTGQPL
ncbi:UvrD-helicase domain-containing protein [Streptomyces sp. TRM 70361]|uniref:UvrD-helicase domain-containing protein n=1 Tax=Streptomyces sp. TRM 70361 TaxID=3116553 RepID=UPI002E7AF443|nr:UvrD-helicase domain-containing protein [Streptomyces sp. TRM 70361]MEE1943019.1 UvrD-helicase domain-containing protein [Streptomyces sp. TRM 70361]